VPNADASTIFEEFIHIGQLRRGAYDGSKMSNILCEIEAKEKIIKYQSAYGVTDAEIQYVKAILEDDYRALSQIRGD